VPDLLDRLRALLADRYAIERELGRGGMALVYLAQDRKHHRSVALKVFRPELAQALGPERFHREIAIAARLQHPNIVPLYDSGDADGILYYVMPYVEGESLRDRLDREKQLPIDDALRIAGEVADALSHAHSAGMVHRDIKPENVLLSAGHAAVTDFGIARAIGAAAGDRLTSTGITVGTPRYMSPEQAAGSADLDGRSDLYSLGCVLYEMLAGQTPFTGPTAESVLHQHLTADPAPVSQVRPTVPTPVVAVLRRALAKSPADRYATAAQFAESLAAAAAAPLAPPAKATRRSRRGLVAGAAGVATLLMVIGYAVFRGQHAAGAVLPSASSIAVMPLVPVAPDTALARLGRELVVTLSANLDGVGGITTTDAITVLAQVGEGESVDPRRGAELARRLGARSVLHGTVLREGKNARLDVALFDVDGLASLAHATVAGPPDNIAALTDSATLALLKQVWRSGNPPVPSIAAVTTHSLPALRAYLEGERALTRAEFPEAVRAFDRAFAIDSTFWFAFWRSLYPHVYEGTRPDSATEAALLSHRDKLPEADRLVVEATLVAGTLSAQLAQLQEVTRRFPTYWPGWYDYGNLLVHWTPYLGTNVADARAALERTVELNPGFAEAWEHLMWTTLRQRDAPGGARVLRKLEGFATATGFRFNPDLIAYYHALSRLVASGGRDSAALVARDAQHVVAMYNAAPSEFLGVGFLIYGFTRGQVQFNDAMLARGPGPGLQAVAWVGDGFAQVARGAWDSALVAMDHWRRITPDSTAPLVVYGLAVAGALLGEVESGRARALRPDGAGRPAPAWAEGRAELAWLDGIEAYASRDAGGVGRARRQVQASGCRDADLLERSLAAFAADLAGNRVGAAHALAALEWESADHARHSRTGRHHPFINAVNRVFASRWLLAAGDTAGAKRLLTWYEAEFWDEHRFLGVANQAFAAPVLLELAAIADASGDTATAVADYRDLLQRYDMPRGEWVARVADVRARVQRLTGTK
jgi:TolB-like protein